MKTYQHFIDGQSIAPASGEYFDTVNPYTGEVWARIAKGSPPTSTAPLRRPRPRSRAGARPSPRRAENS